MKKVQFSFYLILFLCLLFPNTQQAVNSAPNTTKKETVHKQKKKGFRAWVQKRIIKKLEKAADKNALDKQANFSLLFGILGLILLVILVFTLFSTSGGGWALLIPAVLAIVGDVLALRVLRKTRNDKPKFKKERLKAKWGLAISLAIGGIPLLLLLILLIGS